MLQVAVILAFLSVLYYFAFVRNSKVRKFVRLVGGPPQLPLLGNGLDMNVPSEELAKLCQFEWTRRYGPRFTFGYGTHVYFASNKPEDNEKLLSSTSEIEKGFEYDFISSWLGQGLLTSRGSKWLRRRKMLTPAFHFAILEQCMPIFNKQAEVLVNVLQQDSRSGREHTEICSYLRLCALDVICEAAMGKSIHAQQKGNLPYIQALHEVNASILYRVLRPWLHSDFIWNLTPSGQRERKNLKLLHDFTDAVIQDRKRELEFTKKDKNEHGIEGTSANPNGSFVPPKERRLTAFMDIMLEIQRENPDGMTDIDIREETDTFMFEGHDTSAENLGWIIFLLASNPSCQEKVIEEIDAVFGGDKKRPVTSTDLTQLKYLECCIKESLRLYPSVPYFSRKLKSDLKLDDEVTVPAGTYYGFLMFWIHRNPEVFPDPDSFKPERFYPENSAGRPPFSYIPFSAGSRNCVGQKFALMEEKVILAHIFRNFKVEPVDRIEDATIMIEFVTRPKNGITVNLCPR